MEVIRAQSPIDDTILRYADTQSPDEISRMLDGIITPARVAQRLHELLKTRSWLSAAQEEQLLMLRLRKVLGELETQALSVDNAKLRLSFIQEILKRLDKRAGATDDDLRKLYGNQGRIMGQIIDHALETMKGALLEEQAIDEERWNEIYTSALLQAQVEIQAHQAVED